MAEEVFRCCGRVVFDKKRDRNLQTADLCKEQWLATGFFGKLLKVENSYQVRVVKKLRWKLHWKGASSEQRLFECAAGSLRAVSGVFEDENAVINQRDRGCFPCRALVEPVWSRL